MMDPATDPDLPVAFPHAVRLGLAGVTVRFSDRLDDAANRAALAFRAEIDAARLPGVTETALALGSVYLRLDPMETDADAVIARATELLSARDWRDAALPPGRKRWTIPAAFDADSAPQLDEAADLAGLTGADAVAALTGTPVRVLTLGFAPGQPYLGMLPEVWDIPRQTGLTARIPDGALALAIRQVVLFTAPTPTGWRQVGMTAFRCFRPETRAAVPLSPGDELCFTDAGPREVARLRARARDATAGSDAADGGALVEVIS